MVSHLEEKKLEKLKLFSCPFPLHLFIFTSLQSVSLVRTNQAITIDFKPIELSSTQKHRNVANITFHPLKANYSRFWSGKIIVKTKDKNIKLQIPYQAHVLPG